MQVFSLNNIGWIISGCDDNGGATADRYTVAFFDGDCLGMSDAPTHPLGVSMWCGGGVDPAAETACNFDDLPDHIQAHTVARLNQGLADWAEGSGLTPEECAREIIHEMTGEWPDLAECRP
ncbi:hypothetical protein GTQ45_02070 [Pyruvatibacter mobilis]|uniref:Uncharacterized protein n=1 Tax=Pyruvatibacter mobilis TaxID=1712261 RepID=A0A845Q8B3_9HYPH|nr:hypothetical protein [Pyruvatibacter mobilis]NBG94518.1 hypothetical protein [Pyruvatibacter mobilis]QJD74037.1 hypothetical protein HG718_00620 [Pyruvatibacter mobilis]GGD03582.1 hypothetical protein GCM10011587_04140 [Pyruvatibacter mobilis]